MREPGFYIQEKSGDTKFVKLEASSLDEALKRFFELTSEGTSIYGIYEVVKTKAGGWTQYQHNPYEILGHPV